MKKRWLMIISLLFVFFLSSCNFDKKDDSDIINQGFDCIVTFDANGGSIGNYKERRIYCKEDSYIFPPGENGVPVAANLGYILNGWYTGQKDAEGNVTFLDKFDFATTKITESMTLYAYWTNYYTYTILYGDDWSKSKVINNEDETALVGRPSTNPSWPKHTFLGYYEDENLTTPFDWTVKHEYDENQNVNVYTKWLDGNYVLVSKPSDLKNIKVNTNIYLMNDIDMTGVTTTIDANYSGIFNGNGFKISNMTINYTQSGATDTSVGLFKTLNGATITDVTFENVEVNATVGAGQMIYVGVLAGVANDSTLTNVNVKNVNVTVVYEKISESAFKQNNEICTVKNTTITNVNYNGNSITIKAKGE